MRLAPSHKDHRSDRCGIGKKNVESRGKTLCKSAPLATLEFRKRSLRAGLRFPFLSPEHGTHGPEGRIPGKFPRVHEACLHLRIAQITQRPEQPFRMITEIFPGGVCIEPRRTARGRSTTTQRDAQVVHCFLVRAPACCCVQAQNIAHPACKSVRGGCIGVAHRYIALYQEATICPRLRATVGSGRSFRQYRPGA